MTTHLCYDWREIGDRSLRLLRPLRLLSGAEVSAIEVNAVGVSRSSYNSNR